MVNSNNGEIKKSINFCSSEGIGLTFEEFYKFWENKEQFIRKLRASQKP